MSALQVPMLMALVFSAANSANTMEPTTLEQVLDLLGATLILVGALFTLLAALGLIRFKDLFSRMHAAAKPQMLGLMILCAGLVMMLRSWHWFLICTVVVALQMVAAPVASHLVGRAAYRAGLEKSQSLVIDELKDGAEDPV